MVGQRILIIGSGGAGKTTLSVALAKRLGLTCIHLDQHYWSAGWTRAPRDVWRARLAEILARPSWIIEGNYASTIPQRLERADTLIFLDFPRWLCIWRVLMRTARHYGRTRPLMSPHCPERFDAAFLAWLWRYPNEVRPQLYTQLAPYRETHNIIVLRSPAAVNKFLQQLPANASQNR